MSAAAQKNASLVMLLEGTGGDDDQAVCYSMVLPPDDKLPQVDSDPLSSMKVVPIFGGGDNDEKDPQSVVNEINALVAARWRFDVGRPPSLGDAFEMMQNDATGKKFFVLRQEWCGDDGDIYAAFEALYTGEMVPDDVNVDCTLGISLLYIRALHELLGGRAATNALYRRLRIRPTVACENPLQSAIIRCVGRARECGSFGMFSLGAADTILPPRHDDAIAVGSHCYIRGSVVYLGSRYMNNNGPALLTDRMYHQGENVIYVGDNRYLGWFHSDERTDATRGHYAIKTYDEIAQSLSESARQDAARVARLLVSSAVPSMSGGKPAFLCVDSYKYAFIDDDDDNDNKKILAHDLKNIIRSDNELLGRIVGVTIHQSAYVQFYDDTSSSSSSSSGEDGGGVAGQAGDRANR